MQPPPLSTPPFPSSPHTWGMGKPPRMDPPWMEQGVPGPPILRGQCRGAPGGDQEPGTPEPRGDRSVARDSGRGGHKFGAVLCSPRPDPRPAVLRPGPAPALPGY